MHITKFTVVLDFDGFKKALDVLHKTKKSGIEFDFTKSASPMQTVGSGVFYNFELTVWHELYPPMNLYPLLREIEKEVDNL